MRQSKLFTKTLKKAPKDEKSVNSQLLVRAGFVDKLTAGVYSFLPLGVLVLKKIENIIRQEMNDIGGQEILMPALHPADKWKRTGGWDSIDILFKIKSRTGKEYALGQSHEEVVTPLVKSHSSSYTDFPIFVYQIQNKFRDELRAKSGILRGREFGMKDMYSFHLSRDDFESFYEKAKQAYLNIFNRCGLEAKITEGSGGSFSEKISYEFMVLTEAGEDDILYCSSCNYCVNVEIAKLKEGQPCPKCAKSKLSLGRASEVGNVFDLGQKYSRDFDFWILNENGGKTYPTMGCYGIGTTRLMGVIVEKHNDKSGIIWPREVAPYAVHLMPLGSEDKIIHTTEKIYEQLCECGIEVLYDDRADKSAGEKFADSDLIGIPTRVIVSEKTVASDSAEVKERGRKNTKLIKIKKLNQYLENLLC